MKTLSHRQVRDMILAAKSSLLADNERHALQHHLHNCSDCQEFAVFHQNLQLALLREGPAPVSDQQIVSIVKVIQSRSKRKRTIKQTTTFLRFAVGFGLILLVLAVVLKLLPNGIHVQGSNQKAPDSSSAGIPIPETLIPSTVTGNLELPTMTPTILPAVSYQRSKVITYTVKTGDSLFSIADAFGLTPETILWSNFETLADNPHRLSPGMMLYILPVDGVYYHWQPGDLLDEVAARFEVDPNAILNYPGNDLQKGQNPNPGTWVVIPGGKRPFNDWSTITP